MDFKGYRLFIFGYSILWLADGRGGFYMCPKKDLTSITDPAQDPACMIGALR